MTIKEALKIAEQVTGINPRDMSDNRTKGERKLAVKLTVLFFMEEFGRTATAYALNTSEGNVYYHFNSGRDMLARKRAFKQLYWKLRAAVEEFENADRLRAAA